MWRRGYIEEGRKGRDTVGRETTGLSERGRDLWAQRGERNRLSHQEALTGKMNSHNTWL